MTIHAKASLRLEREADGTFSVTYKVTVLPSREIAERLSSELAKASLCVLDEDK